MMSCVTLDKHTVQSRSPDQWERRMSEQSNTLVSWSLTSLFSTNMAISETKSNT